MKKLCYGLILLLAAIGLGYLIQQDPGYISIYYHQWSATTSLWFGLIAISIMAIIFYYSISLLKYCLSLHNTINAWSQRRRHKKALGHIDQGLCYLLNHDWKNAQRTFNKSNQDSPNPLVNYYFAAMAAQQQGQTQSRNDLLNKAYRLSETFEIPVLLYQAQLQIDSQQWEDALATLERVYPKAPNNKQVLFALHTVALQLKQWPLLEKILPSLDKQQVVDKPTLNQLYQELYLAYLGNPESLNPLEQIEQRWQHIPRPFKANPSLVYRYCQLLIAHAEYTKAIDTIENFLRKTWYSPLVALYSNIPGGQIQQRILIAEKWLQQHPNNEDTLFCLAQLSMQEQQWTKAQDYLNSCQKHSPNKKYTLALASLFELTGQHQAALQQYKDCVENQ